jgi:hypothetical protein
MFQTKPTFVGSKSKLLTRLATRPIRAMLQNTHMGRFSPNHGRENRRFSHPHHPEESLETAVFRFPLNDYFRQNRSLRGRH